MLLRRHRILKRFLADVLALPEKEAEEVGCKMEHAIRGKVLNRFVMFLRFYELQSGKKISWAGAFRKFCEKSSRGRKVQLARGAKI